jgi:hypothetical protein
MQHLSRDAMLAAADGISSEECWAPVLANPLESQNHWTEEEKQKSRGAQELLRAGLLAETCRWNASAPTLLVSLSSQSVPNGRYYDYCVKNSNPNI